MNVTVIGTGFIGGTLGRALAGRGHQVTFGSRHPEPTMSRVIARPPSPRSGNPWPPRT